MNVTHPNFGQTYRLTRAVLQMGDFTVSELESLSGAGENTIYSFIDRLEEAGTNFLTSTNLVSEGRGRPRKRYSITEAGAAYLTNRSAEMARLFTQSAPRQPATVEAHSSTVRSPAVTAARGPGDKSTIHGTLIVKGEVAGSESLYVDGKVEGAISIPGNRVTIGRHGQVNANVVAREVVIFGNMRGNVTASDRVEIRSEGSLTGDVAAQRISIEDGAFFKGGIVLKGGIDIRKSEQKEKDSYAPAPAAAVTAS
jgi:cytoskeletal protein CcmA (bactofilin family)